MSKGILLSVTVDNLSTALTADAVLGQTVLDVGNAAVFDEKGAGGLVSVDGQVPYMYVAADPDANTVTLGPFGLAADADTDASVVLYTPDRKIAEVRTAHIDSDADADEDLEAVIDTRVADNYPEGDGQAGTLIEYEPDEVYGYRVTKAPEQPRKVTVSRGQLNNGPNQTIPDSATVWTQLVDWESASTEGTLAYDWDNDWFVVPPGAYLAVVTVRWESNATGFRRVRCGIVSQTFGTITGQTEHQKVAESAQFTQQVTQFFTCSDDDGHLFVYAEVMQNSGGNLDVIGDGFYTTSSFSLIRLDG